MWTQIVDKAKKRVDERGRGNYKQSTIFIVEKPSNELEKNHRTNQRKFTMNKTMLEGVSILSLSEIITKKSFKTRDKSKNYRNFSTIESSKIRERKNIRFQNDRKETRKTNLSIVNQPFVSPKTFASSSVLLSFSLLQPSVYQTGTTTGPRVDEHKEIAESINKITALLPTLDGRAWIGFFNIMPSFNF